VPGFVIREAATHADYQAFGDIIRAYVDWCRERYKDDQWLIDMAFGYQALDQELEDLSAKYGPPAGKTLLAFDGDTALGGVAYRKLTDDISEMKRLYVLDAHAGRGVGRKLCQALTAQAKDDGYTLMRLDTSRDMTEALKLYASLGFTPCAPYIDYPERMRPMIVFLELPLTSA
jgi:GNAT superfamily N-acetyltransferase